MALRTQLYMASLSACRLVGVNATRKLPIGWGHSFARLPAPDIPRMSNFRLIDRGTGFLMPPSVDEWLPERHLARFVVEVTAGLDLRAMTGRYRGSGAASYHPQLLLGIIIYGRATGVFSSRKPERATYFSPADRDAVRPGAGRGTRDGRAEDGHASAGWDQDPRQRPPSQRAVA